MASDKSKRPNLILILADDMGFSDIGCFGGEIATPNLDRMAANGLRASQMYNVARCCPSRACLLTGLYPHQAGVGHMTADLGIPAYQGYLNDSCVTLAEALKSAGYRTAMVGKWHVGGAYGRAKSPAEVAGTPGYPTPRQRGFERFFGTLEGAADYYHPQTLMRGEEPVTLGPEDDFYYTEAIGRESCAVVEELAGREEPFFLYMAFTAPHWPLHAREEDIRRYEEAGTYAGGWDATREGRYRRLVEMGLIRDQWEISPRDDEAPDWETVADKTRESLKMAVYAAQVEAMDRAVGQVLDTLRESGAEDNTLLLFLSDNGGCAEELPDGGWVLDYARDTTIDGRPVEIGNGGRSRPGGEDTYMSYGLPWANVSNTPFRLFKHWIHEGGISTPLVAQWKGGIAARGEIIHEPMHFVDVMPTFLELAGAAYPAEYGGRAVRPMQGESFAGAFRGEWRRARPIFWEHEGNCGMRRGRYKLVRKYPGPFELYDIEADRTELRNLAAGLPDVLEEMKRAYAGWAERTEVRDWERILNGM